MPDEIFIAVFTVAVLAAVFVGVCVVDACKLQRLGLLSKDSRLAADCQEKAAQQDQVRAA